MFLQASLLSTDETKEEDSKGVSFVAPLFPSSLNYSPESYDNYLSRCQGTRMARCDHTRW